MRPELQSRHWQWRRTHGIHSWRHFRNTRPSDRRLGRLHSRMRPPRHPRPKRRVAKGRGTSGQRRLRRVVVVLNNFSSLAERRTVARGLAVFRHRRKTRRRLLLLPRPLEKSVNKAQEPPLVGRGAKSMPICELLRVKLKQRLQERLACVHGCGLMTLINGERIVSDE